MKSDTKGRGLRGSAALAAVGAALSLGGCSDLLDVEVPGNLTEPDLFTPESAQIIVNSLIADFECSYSMMSATASGYEDTTWRTSGYWTAQATYFGERPGGGSCTGNSDVGTNYFTGFQASRWMAESAFEQLGAWTAEEVPNRDPLMATAAVYAGLHYEVYGGTYCEYAPAVGPILTPRETLGVAEGWFTQGLDILGGSDTAIVSTSSLKQLAYLARARVRLAMGDHAGAAADAAQVQPGFVAWITRDSSVRGRWNAVFQAINVNRWRTVGGPMYWNDFQDDRLVSAGYYNLTISDAGYHTVGDGMPDPRVPTEFTGEFAQDGITNQWTQLKYNSLSDPQPLAKWAEAQLILAEVEGGQGAVDRINAVRDLHGLPHFSSSDEGEIFQAIIEERRRELFFEGRFHADKLRYGLWFPRGRGKDHKGFQFGFAYCLLMPVNEYQLNQNIVDAHGAGYEGPDLQDLGYEFELEMGREVEWPVPSSL